MVLGNWGYERGRALQGTIYHTNTTNTHVDCPKRTIVVISGEQSCKWSGHAGMTSQPPQHSKGDSECVARVSGAAIGRWPAGGGPNVHVVCVLCCVCVCDLRLRTRRGSRR